MGLFSDGFKELKKADVPLYKTPKSIQETIEIVSVAENGGAMSRKSSRLTCTFS